MYAYCCSLSVNKNSKRFLGGSSGLWRKRLLQKKKITQYFNMGLYFFCHACYLHTRMNIFLFHRYIHFHFPGSFVSKHTLVTLGALMYFFKITEKSFWHCTLCRDTTKKSGTFWTWQETSTSVLDDGRDRPFVNGATRKFLV